MSHRTILEIIAAVASALTAATGVCQEAPSAPQEPIRTIPAQVSAEAGSVIAGINAFSLDLYRSTLQPEENHFLSPASVSVAIGLAYRGARGTTADELRKTLHFGMPPPDYLRASGQVLETMAFAGPLRELRTANAIWLQEGMPLNPDYERDVATFAKAGFKRVDFRADPDAARSKVNGWVAESTRDKIVDLLEQEDVTEKTRAILVNAIYWKGAWANAFDPKQTKLDRFTLPSGDRVSTPLMEQRAAFQVMERGGIRAILLPYIGHEVELALFLPQSAKGLPKFEKMLTADGLSDWMNVLARTEFRDTVLTMPTMHVEWRADLKTALEAMGAPVAFSDSADFAGMAELPYPGERQDADGLKISHVIHKTYLDVDEAGSEAAAATAVVMDIIVTGGPKGPPPPPPFIFRADKPFLFLLRDRRTGVILFMGRYVRPQSTVSAGN